MDPEPLETTGEELVRRCTCPLSHQIAGVCPKLAFLATLRHLGPREVLARVREARDIPACTDTGPAFECTCRPLHFVALATCPKRKLVPDGNRGSRCRITNYGATGPLIGIVGDVLSPATFTVARSLAHPEVTVAEFVALVLSRERDREATEAAAMLTNRALVDWNPSKEAPAPPPPAPLPVGLPVRIATRKGQSKGVHLVTAVNEEWYEVTRLADGRKFKAPHKDVSPDAFPGVELLVSLPHGCTATNQVARGRQPDAVWTAHVTHEWAEADVRSATALAPGAGYRLPPLKVGTFDAAPSVCGVVVGALETEGWYRVWFAWVIAARNVHVASEVTHIRAEQGPIESETSTGAVRLQSVPYAVMADGQQHPLLGIDELRRARPVTAVTSVTDVAASTLLCTASTRITADIALAIVTCQEPDEALRVGRIQRLCWLASSASVVRRRPPTPTAAAARDARRVDAIRVGLEMCRQTRALIATTSIAISGGTASAIEEIARIQADLRLARRLRSEAWDAPERVFRVVEALESQSAFVGTQYPSLRAVVAAAEEETRALQHDARFGGLGDAAEDAEAAEAAGPLQDQLDLHAMYRATFHDGAAGPAEPVGAEAPGEAEKPGEAAEAAGPAEAVEAAGPAETEAEEGPHDLVGEAIEHILGETVPESGEVLAIAPVAAQIAVAYVPLIALRSSIFDTHRPVPRDRERHAKRVLGTVTVGGETVDFQGGTVFAPVKDESGHEWFEATMPGYDRVAIVGRLIVGVSGGKCTKLAEKQAGRWPDGIEVTEAAHGVPTAAEPLPRECGLARSLGATLRASKASKRAEPRGKPERDKMEAHAQFRTIMDTVALEGRHLLVTEIPELPAEDSTTSRVKRARAATAKCRASMAIALARTHTASVRAALECDMRLYEARASIAERLLAAVESTRAAQTATWADVADAVDATVDAVPAFGATGSDAARIFCAARGLAEDAGAHAEHVRALEATDAGRRVSAALLPALPFGRALVAALGASCARPSFGRRYV
jgi:hypothetical protein